MSSKAALDLEWNSQEGAFDRDLYAFSTLYNADAIDVGTTLNRGESLDNDRFSSLGKNLKNDGTEDESDVVD